MKTRILYISSLFLSLLIFSSCGSDAPADHLANLESYSDNIEKVAEKSESVSSAEEAFTTLRDLNQEIKNVRGTVLAIDAEYKDLTESEFESVKQSPEFKQRMQRFEQSMEKMDASLQQIKSNVDPYKSDEQVSQMYDKLESILISR
ncbi:MAG: hypothetical protein ACQESX_11240 [Bacteroidota bacterium]